MPAASKPHMHLCHLLLHHVPPFINDMIVAIINYNNTFFNAITVIIVISIIIVIIIPMITLDHTITMIVTTTAVNSSVVVAVRMKISIVVIVSFPLGLMTSHHPRPQNNIIAIPSYLTAGMISPVPEPSSVATESFCPRARDSPAAAFEQ